MPFAARHIALQFLQSNLGPVLLENDGSPPVPQRLSVLLVPQIRQGSVAVQNVVEWAAKKTIALSANRTCAIAHFRFVGE